MTKCLRCNRTLTDPKSVERGYGSFCYQKQFNKKPDSLEKVEHEWW